MKGIISKDDPFVSWEELALSTMPEVQALIKLLERKGLITQDEILKEVEVLKKDMNEKIYINLFFDIYHFTDIPLSYVDQADLLHLFFINRLTYLKDLNYFLLTPPCSYFSYT